MPISGGARGATLGPETRSAFTCEASGMQVDVLSSSDFMLDKFEAM